MREESRRVEGEEETKERHEEWVNGCSLIK